MGATGYRKRKRTSNSYGVKRRRYNRRYKQIRQRRYRRYGGRRMKKAIALRKEPNYEHLYVRGADGFVVLATGIDKCICCEFSGPDLNPTVYFAGQLVTSL